MIECHKCHNRPIKDFYLRGKKALWYVFCPNCNTENQVCATSLVTAEALWDRKQRKAVESVMHKLEEERLQKARETWYNNYVPNLRDAEEVVKGLLKLYKEWTGHEYEEGPSPFDAVNARRAEGL